MNRDLLQFLLDRDTKLLSAMPVEQLENVRNNLFGGINVHRNSMNFLAVAKDAKVVLTIVSDEGLSAHVVDNTIAHHLLKGMVEDYLPKVAELVDKLLAPVETAVQ